MRISHPDSFTAAALRGTTPASAVVDKMFNKLPMVRLRSWAEKSTTDQDLIVLEASGNSFQVARVLVACGRKVKVLESCHLGKLKEAHANNDKISALRIAKAYLAGTAKEVWVPDLKTQERRDWFHALLSLCSLTARCSYPVILEWLVTPGIYRLHGSDPLASRMPPSKIWTCGGARHKSTRLRRRTTKC